MNVIDPAARLWNIRVEIRALLDANVSPEGLRRWLNDAITTWQHDHREADR